MANVKQTVTFIDHDQETLSAEVQAMLKQDRALYDQQKQLRKAIAAAINEEVMVAEGETVSGIAFTRWGQFQLVIKPTEKPASTAKPRKTLAQYQAERGLI